ncbi:kinesin-like protein 3 [Selaginella moellendorffii]|uniref:kinesin-like protein 3 n=1 Tax=Selaginella moellendorffii TaxID=88036 RepID=UPI000D1C2369|nr:kinesin-like protein 3 [Selaginella moellendorffii]|eukprot:XP_024523446.1 kinesin-like protein 3 [Selaginella moellendorffii]
MGQFRIRVHLRLRPSDKHSSHFHLEHKANGLPSIVRGATQEAVFERCAAPALTDVLNGYNGNIVAYGQVGSGKTFTMAGETKVRFLISIPHIKAYEVVYDLLMKNQAASNLVLMEGRGIMEVKGLRKTLCRTEADAMKLLFEGGRRRSVASHPLSRAVLELRRGQNHISFRQSRLTAFLRDAIVGNGKTVLIVCAVPEDDYLDETMELQASVKHFLADGGTINDIPVDTLSQVTRSSMIMYVSKEYSWAGIEHPDDILAAQPCSTEGVGELDGQAFIHYKKNVAEGQQFESLIKDKTIELRYPKCCLVRDSECSVCLTNAQAEQYFLKRIKSLW